MISKRNTNINGPNKIGIADRFSKNLNMKPEALKRYFGILTVFGATIITVFLLTNSRPDETSAIPVEVSTPAEQPTNADAQCLRDVLENLPMKDGKAFAHHWDARTGKWNEDIRFEKMDLTEKPCVVMDVGGSTQARDTEKLLGLYKWCRFHVYEPVPDYHAALTKYYSNRKFKDRVTIHPVGIGRTTHQVSASKKDLMGESTFLGGTTSGPIKINIQSVEEAMDSIRGAQKISLLHMNCEGCEWDVLLWMGEKGLFSRVKYIQFSSHNYGPEGVGVRGVQLCRIREYLRKTHTMVKGVPFGWERWVLI